MNAHSKSEILARHHCLHATHARVSDPLFDHSDFFDPQDLLLVKYETLRRVRVDRWTVARAARAAALSRTAWYDALHRWEQAGLIGLVPDPRGPRHPRRRVKAGCRFLANRVPATDSAQKRGSLRRRGGCRVGRPLRVAA
jgi:hypothetical protein